jgi:3-methyladenine DNA glycosylase AlkD
MRDPSSTVAGSGSDQGATPNRALLHAVRDGLARAADPAKAPSMQAYMKSAMPYFGVQAPAQRQIVRAAFAAHPLDNLDEWRATVLALWREATHREERYAALDLAGAPRYRAFRTTTVLPMYEEMIVTGAWWDVVDAIATRQIGELLGREPDAMRAAMLAWSRDPNLWKRRAAIICQVNRKRQTDVDLLHRCIEANIDDRDFFIRKAIGWARRAHAWAEPESVCAYVARLGDGLSPLSRREALKNVDTMTSAGRRTIRSPR